MDGSNDSGQYSRIPTLNDLITLCRHLNDYAVKYVIIGGFAVIRHGYIRATGDIDLLVENTHENIELLKNALAFIPDGESDKIADDDLDKYQIVRVSGEITVDILASVHPRIDFGHERVSNPEMRIFAQDQENQGIMRRHTVVRRTCLRADTHRQARNPAD